MRSVGTSDGTSWCCSKSRRPATGCRKVRAREAKRREEAAAAFTEAGRTDRAEAELAERDVLARYLPQPLTDEELAALVDEVLAAEGLDSPKQMGQAMKAVMARVAGRAEGRRVADVVKAKLAGG